MEDDVQVSATFPSVHWNDPDRKWEYTHLRNIYVKRRNAVEVIAVDVSASEGIVTEV